jgi:hypothetical protein
MTLVPWWTDAASHRLMFLHVLRDGRDIAFSANQGPVNKFYAPMYSRRISQVPTSGVAAKGIKLWGDWNNGLRVWAQDKIKMKQQQGQGQNEEGKHNNDNEQFDYLPVHIEDLVHPSDLIRLNAIVHLAKFVGSGR